MDWLNDDNNIPIQKLYALTIKEMTGEFCTYLNNVDYLRLENKDTQHKEAFKIDTTNITDYEKLKEIGKKTAEEHREKLKEFMYERFNKVYI